MFAFILSLCPCLSIWNHPPSQAESSSVNWNALLRELAGILLGHCVYLQIQLSELSQNHGYADKHGPVLYSLQTPVTSWAWIVCNHDRNNNNNNNSSNSWLAGFIAIHDVLMYSASALPHFLLLIWSRPFLRFFLLKKQSYMKLLALWEGLTSFISFPLFPSGAEKHAGDSPREFTLVAHVVFTFAQALGRCCVHLTAS